MSTISRMWALSATVAIAPVLIRPDTAAEGASYPASSGPRLVVSYPGPGWRAASPRAAITFSGADIASLGNVVVTGSVSGPHPGRMHALRLGRGAVFTPDRRFQPGERVTVQTAVPVMGAEGTTYSFVVSRPSRSPLQVPDFAGARRFVPGAASSPGIGHCRLRRRRYRTRPDLRPVRLCMTRRPTRDAARGRILVTPRSHPERDRRDQHSVMILSGTGRLLWYSRRPDVARDLKTITYRGDRLLAFYQSPRGGPSHYEVLDRHYRVVMRIRARNGYRVDTHELQFTRAGTVYLSAYQPVWDPLARRLVTDYVIQEIDPETRDVLFEWHALDHVPPSATYQRRPPAGTSWDYFHGNSIEPPEAPGAGTIVVSARNTSAVYGIDRATGALRWTLGGRRDEFGLVEHHPTRQFCAQHDARRQPDGDITLFDNGGAELGNMRDCPVHKARVQRFRLDTSGMRAHLVRTVPSEPSSETGAGYYVWAMGSARRQPNGNLLISWGTSGRLTEVTPGGRVSFGLRLERYTYRAVRSSWTGVPLGRPAIEARRRAGDSVTVWASWNGATEVRRWRVLAGRSPSTLRPAGKSFRFAGFESSTRVRTRARYVAVQALDSAGTVLGRSRASEPRPPPRRGPSS